MSFRGINTTVIQIRRQVFTEVARMAYANVKGEQANHLMRKIPYTIIPGEEGKLRKDIFLERAIVEERVRLAMGLPTRHMDEHNSVVSGLEDASIADKYYDPPLVNVIKFACNRCPEKLVKVSDLCQGCLAHPCMEVCPKKAITWESGRSIIDQEKCIKCGRCVGVCPYNAIVSVSVTALNAVPPEYEQGSLALGATDTETWFKISVPAAKSGIAAGIVLGIGRAIGEAMAVMMVAGNSPNMPDSVFRSVTFLTTAIAKEMSYAGGLQRQALFSIALVLFGFIMIINVVLNVVLKGGDRDA